jgi:hypothetical protein
MADGEPDDPEFRKMEREYDHREKQLEETNKMLKEAPSLLGELTKEVILPLLSGLQSQQNQQMWQPPEQQREEPEYNPQVDGVSDEKAENVRENLNLNGGEKG